MARTRYDEADSGYAAGDGIFRPAPDTSGGEAGSQDSGAEEGKALSVSELLYSSSSYYAIAKPGKQRNVWHWNAIRGICLTFWCFYAIIMFRSLVDHDVIGTLSGLHQQRRNN